MKFVFTQPKDDTAVKTLPLSGEFETDNMNAAVNYRIDSDGTMLFSVDAQWLKADDIDEIIAFLNAAKEQL